MTGDLDEEAREVAVTLTAAAALLDERPDVPVGALRRAARLLTLLAGERPADGCKRCDAPVEQQRMGRPRLYCQRCSPPRCKVEQSPSSAT